MNHVAVAGYEEWRQQARALLRAAVPPEEVVWTGAQDQAPLAGLFNAPPEPPAPVKGAPAAMVPKEFLELAPIVACHRESERWALLYRVLWRISHGEHDLLKIDTDDDVRRLLLMQKAVERDMHKMKAFVRFRKVVEDGEETFIAWHRPDHLILEQVAPFFVRRFGVMRWALLTPDQCAYWNTQQLTFGPGVPATAAPSEDALEEMWRSYYASVFNPARLKLKAMRAEMPVRHWPTLPETKLIPELIQKAEARVQDMQTSQKRSAAEFLPATRELPMLRAAAATCEGCELYKCAHQTVFGDGPDDAKVVLIGEQPGDKDDEQGRPFSGPAGKLLDKALAEAGIHRPDVYITNTVKHFKYVQRGPRRIHEKANGAEIAACRPWLDAELAALQPRLIVCLGATAASAMMGRTVTISRERGAFRPHPAAESLFITMHPSAVLRVPDPQAQDQAYEQLVADLKLVKAKIDEYASAGVLSGVN